MSLQIIGSVLSLAIVGIGGLSQAPIVQRGGQLPISKQDLRPGTYYIEVERHDHSDNGLSLVRPSEGGTPMYCVGRPLWIKEKAVAKVKYNGFDLSCRFVYKDHK